MKKGKKKTKEKRWDKKDMMRLTSGISRLIDSLLGRGKLLVSPRKEVQDNIRSPACPHFHPTGTQTGH